MLLLQCMLEIQALNRNMGVQKISHLSAHSGTSWFQSLRSWWIQSTASQGVESSAHDGQFVLSAHMPLLAVLPWPTAHIHTHTHTPQVYFTYGKLSEKQQQRGKKKNILLIHLQILAPHKRASVLASFHLPNIFQMAAKLTQRRRWLVSAKSKDCYHPKKTHPHTQRFYTWQCRKRQMDKVLHF